MSTLNVSNITDGTTTVGTSYVVNGSAKAWVNFNGTGTIAARDSLNLSSLTDNGAGDYTVTVTNAMADANYAVSHGRSDATNGRTVSSHIFDGQTTTAARLISRVSFSNSYDTLEDAANVYIVFFGDLA